MTDREQVIVEFFGIPRQRAGRAEIAVPPGMLSDVLAVVERSCPGLAGLVEAGRLAPHYLLSLQGCHFLSDLQQPLCSGDHLLLLTADVGG